MKFFAADWLVGEESFGHQAPVGRDAQTGMVVEVAPLIVPQPEVLLQILVVALDARALMCDADTGAVAVRNNSDARKCLWEKEFFHAVARRKLRTRQRTGARKVVAQLLLEGIEA